MVLFHQTYLTDSYFLATHTTVCIWFSPILFTATCTPILELNLSDTRLIWMNCDKWGIENEWNSNILTQKIGHGPHGVLLSPCWRSWTVFSMETIALFWGVSPCYMYCSLVMLYSVTLQGLWPIYWIDFINIHYWKSCYTKIYLSHCQI